MPPRRVAVALLALLFVLAPLSSLGTALGPGLASGADVPALAVGSPADAPVAPLADGAVTAPAATDAPVIRAESVVHRTPGDVGRVRVAYTVRLPAEVVSFAYDPADVAPRDPTVTATDGFAYDESRGAWVADSARGETTTATLTYTLPTNVSAGSGYDAVETADWAFVRLPARGGSWRYVGTEPGYAHDASVAGEGHAGSQFAFLGPVETYVRDAGGSSFRLVVPAAADPARSPGATLDTLASAPATYDPTDGGATHTAFVLPDPMRRGGQSGGPDLWVHAAATDRPDVLLHEYVHTQQRARFASDAEWVTEASAEYYGALLAWRAGDRSAAWFRDHVATDRHADAVLQDGNAVAAEPENYHKGRRVLAALDARIRERSGGEATLADVVADLHGVEGRVTYADLRASVVAHADAGTGAWLDRYVTTSAVPEIPTDVEAAYGDGVDTDPADGDDDPTAPVALTAAPSATTVAPGETVTVTYRLTNGGDEAADGGRLELRPGAAFVPGTAEGDGSPALAGSPPTVFYGLAGPVAPDETRTTTVTYAVPADAAPGERTLTATGYLGDRDASVSTTVTVTAGVGRFDTNGQAGIQAEEVQAAIVAFATGGDVGGHPVSVRDVQRVIVAFNSN